MHGDVEQHLSALRLNQLRQSLSGDRLNGLSSVVIEHHIDPHHRRPLRRQCPQHGGQHLSRHPLPLVGIGHLAAEQPHHQRGGLVLDPEGWGHTAQVSPGCLHHEAGVEQAIWQAPAMACHPSRPIGHQPQPQGHPRGHQLPALAAGQPLAPESAAAQRQPQGGGISPSFEADHAAAAGKLTLDRLAGDGCGGRQAVASLQRFQ